MNASEQFTLQYKQAYQKGLCGFTLIPMGLAAIVILSNLPGDVGISITNGIEGAASEAYRRHLMPKHITPDKIVWIEHYPKTQLREEAFDRVILSWEHQMEHFAHPQWSHLGRDGLQNLMNSFGVEGAVPDIRFSQSAA